jgi:hypothetical protein
MWIQIDITGELSGNIGAILAYGEFDAPEGEDIFIDEVNHSLEFEDYTPSEDGSYNPDGWNPKIE